MMQESRVKFAGLAILVVAIALTGVAIWKTQPTGERPLVSVMRQPQRVMGTTCRLIVVVPQDEQRRANEMLDAAEQRLRHIESLCSTYIETSELSRFNTGQIDQLGETTGLIANLAHGFWRESDGAFDVTARPQFQLWKRCAAEGRLPRKDEIAAARELSHWQLIVWDRSIPRKTKPTVQFDLGGIAKGYAIQQALVSMHEAGAVGGLVDVGGDVHCFGVTADGGKWEVGLRDPFGQRVLFHLKVRNRAVCTSGNYARFVEIDGKRYSHIIDPRTGMPADHVPSVTVIAMDATTADAWATALSVLGPSGLEMLPEDTEAMIVTGTSDDYDVHTTPGFNGYMGKFEVQNSKLE